MNLQQLQSSVEQNTLSIQDILDKAKDIGDLSVIGTSPVDADKLIIRQNSTGTTFSISFSSLKSALITFLAGGLSNEVFTKLDGTDFNTAWKLLGLENMEQNVRDSWGILFGLVLDSPAITVTSNGTTIALNLEKSGGGDIRCVFSTGFYTFDCTPIASVNLTAGTDIAPTLNYVYILESTKALTVSTSGWPVTEYIAIATVMCQSAASLQTYGAYKLHAWTDHTSNTIPQGHIGHINYWIRQQQATWVSGVATTPTVNDLTPDTIDVATTAGVVLQLHEHIFPAFNTATGSSLYVVNDFTTAYNRITKLSQANKDSAGNTVGNNNWVNWVIFGVVNENSSDCKLFVNVPSAFHTTEAAALADVENYSDYSVPAGFIGTIFPIARIIGKYTTAGSGTWEITETKSLLSGVSIGLGGGGTATNEFVTNVFRLLDSADPTKKIIFDVSNALTGETPTITVGGEDVDLRDIYLESFACSDETSSLETGTVYSERLLKPLPNCSKFDFAVVTAPTGSTIIIDVKKNGTTVFSTKATIDATEFSTLTAATPQVISGGQVSFVAGDLLEVVIDQVGSTVKGANLKAQITYNT